MTNATQEKLLPGTRVRLIRECGDYPIRPVPAGELGTVTYRESNHGVENHLWVLLDSHFEDLDEWQNQIQISQWEHDRPPPEFAVEVIYPSLVAEFEAYCAAQGLPLMSADELACEDVTDGQRAWLLAFVERWNAFEDYQHRARHSGV